MKSYVGCCVSPPWDWVLFNSIIDDTTEIPKDVFLDVCYIPDEQKKNIEQYPNDYRFFRSDHEGVYYFTHSAIEHFYQ